MAELDAWKQGDQLRLKYSKTYKVRDLRVEALGLERSVRLTVVEGENRVVTQRNVGTVREWAAALLAACDDVESWNPEWAGHDRDTPDPVVYSCEVDDCIINHGDPRSGLPLRAETRWRRTSR